MLNKATGIHELRLANWCLWDSGSPAAHRSCPESMLPDWQDTPFHLPLVYLNFRPIARMGYPAERCRADHHPQSHPQHKGWRPAIKSFKSANKSTGMRLRNKVIVLTSKSASH